MKSLKNLIKKVFAITPFRITLFLVTLFAIISYFNDDLPNGVPLVNTLDSKALDIKFQIRKERLPQENIIIATIDEKSIKTFGQWPFDRKKVIAPLLQKLCSLGVSVVATDAVWAEQERKMTSALEERLVKLTSELKASDKFTELMKESSGDTSIKEAAEFCGPKLVFGYALEQSPPEFPSEEMAASYKASVGALINTNKIDMVRKSKRAIIPETAAELNQVNTDFSEYKFHAITNHPRLMPKTISQGYFNNVSDLDGNFRHYMPFMGFNGYFLPSLALKVAMKVLKDADHEIKPEIYLSDNLDDKSSSFILHRGQERIEYPIDKSGKLTVNYYGPSTTYPNISIADILSTEETITYTPAPWVSTLKGGDYEEPKPITYLKKDFFKNAIVLVGATAIGVYDIRPRPFDQYSPGVENHATAIENFIHDDFIKKPNSVTLLAILGVLFAIGLIYGHIINRLNAKPGFAFAVLTTGGLLYFDQFYLFNKLNTFFSGHLQALQFIIQYFAVTVLKYIKEESEKKFIRSAFDKFVSPAVINSMLSDPTKLRIGGEKKLLSILFSDVAGFTELSEKLEAKVLTSFLNEYLGAMTDILQKNNGTLDKYIGDAVMGFWGAPIDDPQHAQNAVKTAFEMQKKIIELNKVFKEKYGFEISARIGINTGDVSVGNFGSSKVFEYTIIGDHVNLASRLEGVNKYYGTLIIISESTYRLLPANVFTCREIDTIKVKGKDKPVKIYEVLSQNEAETNMRTFIQRFSEALNQYYSKQWDNALTHFKKIHDEMKNDVATVEFIRRCEYYKEHPPEENWDGSWKMKEK